MTVITEPRVLRAIAENVTLCTEILELPLGDSLREVKLPLGVFETYRSGKGTISDETVRALAALLGIKPAQLLSRHGGGEKRVAFFKQLLQSTEQATSEPVPIATNATTTNVNCSPPKRISYTTSIDSKDRIIWDVSDTVAVINGVTYDLDTPEVRDQIADRIRFLKGDTPYQTLGHRMVPARLDQWFISLKPLNKELVRQLATILNVPTVSLLTGAGIRTLGNKESATHWIQRHQTTSVKIRTGKRLADSFKAAIKGFSKADQDMLLRYIKEQLK